MPEHLKFLHWIRAFAALHRRARRGELAGGDRLAYQANREDLARALLAAQHVALGPGQKPRRVLRVARALPAEIDFGQERIRSLTLNLSADGFACLLGCRVTPGEEVKVALRLPDGEPLRAPARVIDVRVDERGTARVGFAFLGLAEAEIERLEMLVFDTVLEQVNESAG